jgi:hypothetical protein
MPPGRLRSLSRRTRPLILIVGGRQLAKRAWRPTDRRPGGCEPAAARNADATIRGGWRAAMTVVSPPGRVSGMDAANHHLRLVTKHFKKRQKLGTQTVW